MALLHDSALIDLAEEDKSMLPDIIRAVSDTQWGTFPVNVKIGTDFGNMKKVKIKV
jgi:hypothetical protein